MSVIVGLTGGLKTGKSTVALMFSELGAKIIDADKIAHVQLTKGTKVYRAVVRKFGKNILTKDQIDRNKLAEEVFCDPVKLQSLEKIIHPEVIKVIKEQIQDFRKSKKKHVVIVDVPLLFESKMEHLMDLVIVVASSQYRQIERAWRQLKISRSQAFKRIKAQLPLRVKIQLADIVIDANKNLKNTKKQVLQIWRNISHG